MKKLLVLLLTILVACNPPRTPIEEDFVCSTSHFRKKTYAITQGKPTELFQDVGQIICGKLTCSATLIGEKTVITANHCIPKGITECEFKPGLSDIHYSGEVVRYGGWTDLALLKLEEKVPIQPRLLSEISPQIGDDVIYVGYGITEERGKGIGTKRFGCSKVSSWSAGILFNSTLGSEVCNGDSGGAAIINGALAGVISYKVANCGVGSGSTAVNIYLDWILDKSQDKTIQISDI